MEIPILLLLSCICGSLASEHSHTIPVEGYETELQELGEHVEIPETPIKVIKITKTVAVKVPVPYPVKVIEKVPYPVHINKPYPVPVPQIVKVPYKKSHDVPGGQAEIKHTYPLGSNEPYQVQEQSHDGQSDSYNPQQEQHSYGGYNAQPQHFSSGNEEHSPQGYSGEHYDGPQNSYHGYGDDTDSFESKKYDKAVQQPQFIQGHFNGHNFK